MADYREMWGRGCCRAGRWQSAQARQAEFKEFALQRNSCGQSRNIKQRNGIFRSKFQRKENIDKIARGPKGIIIKSMWEMMAVHK